MTLRSAIQPIGEVNELAGFTLELSFQDDDGAAVIPSTAEWRLVCVETDTVLQDWTSLSVSETYDAVSTLTAATANVVVDGSLHAMKTSSLARERKALIVACDRGSGEYNLECTYTVARLAARS